MCLLSGFNSLVERKEHQVTHLVALLHELWSLELESVSSKTSVMLRIGSPLMTFLTSSASKVSCSTRACANYNRLSQR